jgi:hypothetical protein
MKPRRRQIRFERTLEALEGRQLLSTASDWVHARLHKHSHAHVVSNRVAQGLVGTAYTTPAAARAALVAARRAGTITVPENNPNTALSQSLSTPPAVLSATSVSTNTVFPSGSNFALIYALRHGGLPAATTSFSTAPAASGQASTAATLTPTTTPVTGAGLSGAGVNVKMNAAMAPTDSAPLPMDPFGGTTLSKDDVTNLKQAVDTFAASYTSGAGSTKDQAAVTVLNTSLADIDARLWSETHVASQASVTSIAQAVQSFATSYTSNANPGTDNAAWQALGQALQKFTTGLSNPAAPNSTTTTSSTSTSASTPATPVPPPPPPDGVFMPMDGPQVSWLFGALLNGPSALTADEVSSLKQTVDTFAASYTSGSNTTTDQSALTAFQSGLDAVSTTYWNSQAPPPPAGISPTSGGAVSVPAPNLYSMGLAVPAAARPYAAVWRVLNAAPMSASAAATTATATATTSTSTTSATNATG